MKAAAILAALVLPALVPSAVAGEVGQYAVVVVPDCPAEGSTALIVDTKNGYVWKWCGRCPADGMLQYQGQAMPGKYSGPLSAPSPQQ